MTHPAFPSPGTPIAGRGPNSPSGVLRSILAAAVSAPPGTQLANGIAGPGGIQDAPAIGVELALMEITTAWAYDLSQVPGNPGGDQDASWSYPQNCAYAQAKIVIYTQGGAWLAYTGDSSQDGDNADNDPILETVWHPSGYQLGSGDGKTRAFALALQSTSGSGPYFYPAVNVGEYVWCIRDKTSGQWLVQQPFEDIQPIELKDDLAPGGSATAYLMKPDESDANTDSHLGTIAVYDTPEGNRRALGRDTLTNSHGARGKAKYNHSTQQWEILSLQTISQKIKVAIGTGCVAGGAGFTPTSLAVMDPGGQDVSNGGASYPLIQNYSAPLGSSSGGGTSGIICLWDESLSGYLVVDAPCAVGC
jgi:hypothetical protein